MTSERATLAGFGDRLLPLGDRLAGRHLAQVDHVCGFWLKDKFGLSWQIVPTVLPELLADPDQAKSQRVMAAMMKMKKIEIDTLERAAQG